MSTFTEEQQKQHRTAFIEESKQKAWGAACNAEWIGKQLDELMAQFQKMQQEDRGLEAEIKTLDSAIDYHTKDNRDKRKAHQERRNVLAKLMEGGGQNAARLQEGMQRLYANVEQNLALAQHAETWEWKETGSEEEKGNAAPQHAEQQASGSDGH